MSTAQGPAPTVGTPDSAATAAPVPAAGQPEARRVPDIGRPGARVVQRYRLDTEVTGGAQDVAGEVVGSSFWRAHDELLDRPVGVCLLPAGDATAERVLTAARAAATLADARFLRVLDASETDGFVYVVSEWVTAIDLVQLLEDGALPPHRARALSADIAGALAAAHQVGLAHLCLRPEQVLQTPHGQLKIAGLGVDAAARGIVVDNPAEAARRDTRDAAAVLYAGLTVRWPGESGTALAEAPRDGDALCSPRQVRAGIPEDLDDVVCRALDIPGRRHSDPPLRTPAQLADALAAVQIPASAPATEAVSPPPGTTARYAAPDVSTYDEHGPPPRHRAGVTTWAWVLASLVLVAGLALAGWQLAMTGLGGGDERSSPSPSVTGPTASPPGEPTGPLQVTPGDVTSFDPEGDDDENGDRAGLAVDGKRSTVWTTKTYDDPFGPTGLKDGVGLLVDLGTKTALAEVVVRVQGGATDLEVRVSDSRGEQADDYALFDRAGGADGRAVMRPDEPVAARYVLVWLTDLPAVSGPAYRGEIAEVELRG